MDLISSRDWIVSRMTSSSVVSFSSDEYEHVVRIYVRNGLKGGYLGFGVCKRRQRMVVRYDIIESGVISVNKLYNH